MYFWLTSTSDRNGAHLHYRPSQETQADEYPSHLIESGSEQTKRQQHETDH